MLNTYSFYNSYCTEYKAVLMRAISLGYRLPSVGQQFAQDRLMRLLLSSGIFAAMDVIYILLNDCGLDFGRINWKNPSLFNITTPTTYKPMWHRNLGWTGRPDISDSNPFYADTGFIPATHGVNFAQNLSGVYLMNLSGYGGAGYTFFTESGTTNTNRISHYLYDNVAGYGMNGAATTVAITHAQNIGVLGVDRTASNLFRFLGNGTLVGSNTAVSAARSTNSIKLLGLDLALPTPPTLASPNYPVGCYFIGSALSGALQTTLTTYLAQYKNTMISTSTGTSVGAGNYTVPDGVTEIFVECWGGGGAGRGFPNATATKTGGGGAGGGYSASLLTVTPGAVIPYVIGAGGVGNTGVGTAGGDTSWNSGQVLAKGGAAAAAVDFDHSNGGQASAGVGQIKYSGGGGGSQGTVLNSSCGSGGGAAGALGDGLPGVDAVVGATVALRPRLQLLGPGSPSFSHTNAHNGPGVAGSFGSGGSGARRVTSSTLGGNGGAGYIRVSINKQY